MSELLFCYCILTLHCIHAVPVIFRLQSGYFLSFLDDGSSLFFLLLSSCITLVTKNPCRRFEELLSSIFITENRLLWQHFPPSLIKWQLVWSLYGHQQATLDNSCLYHLCTCVLLSVGHSWRLKEPTGCRLHKAWVWERLWLWFVAWCKRDNVKKIALV